MSKRNLKPISDTTSTSRDGNFSQQIEEPPLEGYVVEDENMGEARLGKPN